MKRIARVVAAFISLALAVASVVLWVRSERPCAAHPFFQRTGSTCFVSMWDGKLTLTRQYVSPSVPPGCTVDTEEFGRVHTSSGSLDGGMFADPRKFSPGALGFTHRIVSDNASMGDATFHDCIELWAVPFWFFTILFAMLPGLLLARWMRERRPSRGLKFQKFRAWVLRRASSDRLAASP